MIRNSIIFLNTTLESMDLGSLKIHSVMLPHFMNVGITIHNITISLLMPNIYWVCGEGYVRSIVQFTQNAVL